MGSFSEQVWVNLDILASNPVPKVPLETVLETVWAITHSVYTNDTEVNFLRLYLGGSEAGSRKEVSKKPLAIIRSFLINQMTKPAEIANLENEIAGDGYDRRQLDLDPSAPRFTQLVRKMVLHITNRDDKQSSSSDFVSQDSVSSLITPSEQHFPLLLL
jgi:Fe-S-cluster formation regulator IscX/YfhJ